MDLRIGSVGDGVLPQLAEPGALGVIGIGPDPVGILRSGEQPQVRFVNTVAFSQLADPLATHSIVGSNALGGARDVALAAVTITIIGTPFHLTHGPERPPPRL